MVSRQILASALAVALLISVFSIAPVFAAGTDCDEVGAPAKEEAAEAMANGGPPSAPVPAFPKKQKSTYPAKPKPKTSYLAEDWTVAFYPVLAWSPIMGGNVSMPDLPDEPGVPGGGIRQGNVSSGLSGAAFFGLGIQKKRFVTDITVLWASIGSSSDQPPITLDSHVLLYDAMAGFKASRDLSFTVGARHIGLNIDARLGDRPGVTWKPGVTDPILGMNWRPSLSKHWGLDIAIKGGGFGVGSDTDLSGTGRLDWRFARHFGITLGYGGLHFKVSEQITTSAGTFTRETKQTLHGPIFGFGIYF